MSPQTYISTLIEAKPKHKTYISMLANIDNNTNSIQDKQTWVELMSHRYSNESEFIKKSNQIHENYIFIGRVNIL